MRSVSQLEHWVGAQFRSWVALVVCAALGCASGGARAPSAAIDPIEAVADPVDQARVFDGISRARASKGLAPAAALAETQPIDAAAAVIESGGSPSGAFQTAMKRVAEQESTSILAWAFETSDLDRVPLPDLLLDLGQVTVATLVVRRRAPPLPAHYTVYLLLVGDNLGASSPVLYGNGVDE